MNNHEHKYNFSNLIKYLEDLLKETSNDKTKLEDQCEESFNVIQSLKMETRSKDTVLETVFSQSEPDETEDVNNENKDEIDEATNENIDKVIAQARNVRKKINVSNQNSKIQKTSVGKIMVKSTTLKNTSSKSSQSTSQRNQNCKESLSLNKLSISKSSKSCLNVQNSYETLSMPSSFKNYKSPKQTKSPYSSPHFQTSYQKHFSVKHLVKTKLKTEAKSNNSVETKSSKKSLEPVESCSGQISGNRKNTTKTEMSNKTTENICQKNPNFIVWNEQKEDSKPKSLEEAVSVLGVSTDISYVLKLYHQYLKRIKTSNDSKDAAFKSQFIEDFEKLNNKCSPTNSESKLLLQEQIKKYLDLSNSLNPDEKTLRENEPMFTSYSSVTKLKMLEEKHLKLQKLKMQLNLYDIVLNELKNANIDETQTIPLYKTLTALCDLTKLSLPIVIKND